MKLRPPAGRSTRCSQYLTPNTLQPMISAKAPEGVDAPCFKLTTPSPRSREPRGSTEHKRPVHIAEHQLPMTVVLTRTRTSRHAYLGTSTQSPGDRAECLLAAICLRLCSIPTDTWTPAAIYLHDYLVCTITPSRAAQPFFGGHVIDLHFFQSAITLSEIGGAHHLYGR